MNGWDLFTWICSLVLAVSSVLIFVFFMRDARQIIRDDRDKQAKASESPSDL